MVCVKVWSRPCSCGDEIPGLSVWLVLCSFGTMHGAATPGLGAQSPKPIALRCLNSESGRGVDCPHKVLVTVLVTI